MRVGHGWDWLNESERKRGWLGSGYVREEKRDQERMGLCGFNEKERM